MGGGGVKGALVLFTVGWKTFNLCTDSNPDQYKQYLLRPSAVTKPLFKAKKTQNITFNYEQQQEKKSTEEREVATPFDSRGDSAAVQHKTW